MLAVAAAAAWGERHTPAAEPSSELPQVVHVSKTFNDSPFDYRIESREQKSGYTIYRLTYPSPVVTPLPQNNTVPAEYYVPKGVRAGEAGRAGVVCMHILDGDFVLVRMTCSMLASHGIPAFMLKLPYYDERGLPEGVRALAEDPALFVSALSQGREDVRRAVDVLASRPEVDPEHIGITGISLGGIVAATSAGVEPRFSRAMLILAGGDLKTLIHHARETRELSELIKGLPADRRAEIDRAIDGVDPLRHAADLRDRARQGKVLMVNAAEDEVVPRSCTEKLAAALGITDQVVWLDGLGHYTAMAELPRVLNSTVEFFGQDLPPGVDAGSPPAGKREPLEIVAAILQDLFMFVASEPDQGRCHFIDAVLSATLEGDESIEAQVSFIRGSDGRFKLECDLPVVGEASLGQGSYPWMLSGERAVFRGVGGPEDGPGDPLAFAKQDNLIKVRVVAGAAAGIAVAPPHALNQWLTATEETSPEGMQVIHIVLKDKHQDVGSLRLAMRDDGKTLHQAMFDLAGARGTITVRGWQMNTVAHKSMFDPPAGVPVREVERTDLYRVFSAMFNFVVESAE